MISDLKAFLREQAIIDKLKGRIEKINKINMEDRSKYYKEPLKFGVQTIYESDILSDIDLEHWKNFDEAVKSGQGFKVGDFIGIATNTTAKQLVKFLDEFNECESLTDVKTKTNQYIEEIQKEIKL